MEDMGIAAQRQRERIKKRETEENAEEEMEGRER